MSEMTEKQYLKWLKRFHLDAPYDWENKERNVDNYIDLMINRSQSMFSYKNLPETIDPHYLELLLQTRGSCIFTKIEESDIKQDQDTRFIPGGYYIFPAGLGGVLDFNGRPTYATFANARLNKSYQLKIGEECVLIRNDTLMEGLLPLYAKFATLLNESDITMVLADINARVQSVILASDDVSADRAKQYLKDLKDGRLGVISGNMLFDAIKSVPISDKASDTLTNLIEYHQYILANYYQVIGLNANYNMKREALNSGESGLNEDALRPFVDDMLRERADAIAEINELYGLDIEVQLSSSWRTELISQQMGMYDLMREEPDEDDVLTEDDPEIDPVPVSEEIEETEEILKGEEEDEDNGGDRDGENEIFDND